MRWLIACATVSLGALALWYAIPNQIEVKSSSEPAPDARVMMNHDVRRSLGEAVR